MSRAVPRLFGQCAGLSTARRVLVLAAVLLLFTVFPAAAQNYSMDARVIGLGAIGSTRNVASGLVREQRPYRRIGLPLGLFQVLSNRDIFRPDDVNGVVSDQFDLFRSKEYAASPLNYTFGRDDSTSGQSLVNDVLSDRLNRNLNVYREFKPATRLTAEGVGSPSWGKTFKRRRQDDPEAFHGVYVGAGPYLTVVTETLTDPALVDLLGSPVPLFVPNAVFNISHETTTQLAGAITAGYRFARPAGRPAGERGRVEGVFIAADVNYLVGFHFDNVAADINFETNAVGLIATEAQQTTFPLAVDYLSSSSGRGVSIDVGGIYMVDRWDFGVGVNGIANQITWTGVERRLYVEETLSGGPDADITDAVPAEDIRFELPINVSGNVAYHADAWSAIAEYSRRFEGNNFQGGLEYFVGGAADLVVRGGGRYARDRWHPAAGVGLNLTDRFGVDVALYGSSTNTERRRHASLAVSLRFNRLLPADGTSP